MRSRDYAISRHAGSFTDSMHCSVESRTTPTRLSRVKISRALNDRLLRTSPRIANKTSWPNDSYQLQSAWRSIKQRRQDILALVVKIRLAKGTIARLSAVRDCQE